MNIFFLSENPKKAAQYLCDKHVPKMLLESAQLLCSPFDQGIAPYKRTHYNHPCAKWVRESDDNFQWLVCHANEINEEYKKRFKKNHKSSDVVLQCCHLLRSSVGNLSLPKIGLTQFPQCMPDQYRHANPVVAYRQYYIGEKAKFAKWDKLGKKPYWWR